MNPVNGSPPPVFSSTIIPKNSKIARSYYAGSFFPRSFLYIWIVLVFPPIIIVNDIDLFFDSKNMKECVQLVSIIQNNSLRLL